MSMNTPKIVMFQSMELTIKTEHGVHIQLRVSNGFEIGASAINNFVVYSFNIPLKWCADDGCDDGDSHNKRNSFIG